MSDRDLVLLIEAGDPMELAGVRSLLDGHEISYVVQGEHHSSMVGGMLGNPAISPRVLVARGDLEQTGALFMLLPFLGGVIALAVALVNWLLEHLSH